MAARLSTLLMLLPAFAQAAPPTLTSITPHGVERGKPTTLVLNGTNLTTITRLQLPFAAKQEPVVDPKPNPAQMKLIVTADANVPTGIYPVRVVTQDGLSGIVFLAVDSLPSVAEVEDNNTPEKAQTIALPVIVNGTCAGGDVDYFRFAAKKGQRLVIETETARIGSAVVPQLRLTDDKLRFIAADDTQAHRGECRIIFEPPADGGYILEFSDSRYRGGNPPHYRIKIGDYDVADELFPLGGRRGENATFTLRGGTLAKEVVFQRPLIEKGTALTLALDGLPFKPGMLAPEVAVGDYPEKIWEKHGSDDPKRLDIVAPITINSRLEAKGDVDRFQLPVAAGQKYRFTVQAHLLGSKLDGVLRITDQAGKQLALVDDVVVPAIAPGQQPFTNPDPSADVTVPEGVNLLIAELRDQRKRGGVNFTYRFTVEPLVPDFQLQVTNPELNVPKGGSALLNVGIIRRGYTGPIQLKAVDLPPGYTVQGGLVPANGATGLLTIAASPEIKLGASEFAIEGTAENLKRTAVAPVVVGKDPSAPIILHVIEKIAVSPTSALPFSVQGPANLEIVKGYPTPIPITLTRTKDAEKVAVELAGAVPTQPNVLTFAPVNLAADAKEGKLEITVPVAGPEGQLSFAVQGKAKINNIDVVAVSPAFPITVVRPFTVDGPASVVLTPGQTVPLKFTVTRKGPFKDAVTVRLDGLPAGVTMAAPLAPVPADKTELLVNLKIDPKVAVPMATLTLNASATVNGMAFAHPPVVVNATVKK
jgi:hypothetical protein